MGNEVKDVGSSLNLDDGIRLGAGAYDNVVRDNYVEGANHNGIRVVPTAYDNKIHHNEVKNNGVYEGFPPTPRFSDGIKVQGDYNKIHWNEVRTSGSNIDIHLTSTADYNIVHHNVMDNSVVDSGTGNKVFRNTPPP